MTTVVIPHAAATAAPAPLVQDRRGRRLQTALFVAGAVLLPLGLVMIVVGWYGAAHTQYVYDQLAYLMSGGLLGIGLTLTGGFLYFGAWLAAIVNNQRDASRQLADTLLALAAMPARPGRASASSALVVAGENTTVHRADCALVADRTDLRPITGTEPGLSPCRFCQPLG
jgi:hypothetical protein